MSQPAMHDLSLYSKVLRKNERYFGIALTPWDRIEKMTFLAYGRQIPKTFKNGLRLYTNTKRADGNFTSTTLSRPIRFDSR